MAKKEAKTEESKPSKKATLETFSIAKLNASKRAQDKAMNAGKGKIALAKVLAEFPELGGDKKA